MRIFRLALLQSLCFIVPSIITSCKGKEHETTSGGNCSYEINITEGSSSIISYKSDCHNNGIGQSRDEWLMVLSSDDLKSSLTVSVIGVAEGGHTVKNTPPYGKGTANLFLTSDRSKIPGTLSFSNGTFTITSIKGNAGDGDIKATATSAINNKTYTLTGSFKHMPIRTN